MSYCIYERDGVEQNCGIKGYVIQFLIRYSSSAGGLAFGSSMYNIHFIPIFIGDHLLQQAPSVYNPDCTSRYWTQNPFTVISGTVK